MKYLVVTPGYPSNENLYNNMFVHQRVKEYIKAGFDIEVFSVNLNNINLKYKFENILVTTGGYDRLAEKISNSNYTKILVHFAWKKILKVILKSKKINTKILIWVHGVEGMNFLRRIHNYTSFSPKDIIRSILINIRQLNYFKTIIRKEKDVNFIFISSWLKKVFEKDLHVVLNQKNYNIIPNGIDFEQFIYTKKNKTQRLKILSVRPYSNKNYANDISVKVIKELAKRSCFNRLEFVFYGKGVLFHKTLKDIIKYNNFKSYEQFLNHDELEIMYSKFGVNLSPSRMDTQGVSRCEAMGVGMVVITSKICAIPEFVNNSVGYLCNNYMEMADAIEELANNPKIFLNKSKKAADFIRKKCSVENTILKEIELIKRK